MYINNYESIVGDSTNLTPFMFHYMKINTCFKYRIIFKIKNKQELILLNNFDIDNN